MRKITVEESELQTTLEEINARQNARKTFLNISVKPYKGQKHPSEGNLYTIILG